jgi:phosphatidylinositol-bisphosphatase
MGMMGNKGGVSVRLQFYDSTLCIVNSHLAAHRENVIGRNADFHNIFSKLCYNVGDEAARESIQNGSMPQWSTGNRTVGIADHDLAFWIGDLNYRVQELIPTEQVLDLSKRNNLELLRQQDQLNVERKAGRVFQGWEEGPLNFTPTYKYQPGTDLYEERPDKKLRAPAWCDRVLWKAQEPSHLSQQTYSRSELNISDHKPVMSTFVATIKDVIESKREKVFFSVMKKLDQYENSALPVVEMDKTELDFGEVRYNLMKTVPMKIKNTGKVAVRFRLVPKLDDVSRRRPP